MVYYTYGIQAVKYSPSNFVTSFFQTCRDLLAFVFIPVIQREMDLFIETVWNSHRIRHQKDAQLPKGIPNHVYCFPEKYGAEECGMYGFFKFMCQQKIFI